jgi:hypothetical protein
MRSPIRGVATYELPLLLVEGAALVEDRGGDRGLADVVQSRGETREPYFVLGLAECFGDGAREL